MDTFNSFDLALEILAEVQQTSEGYLQAHTLAVFVEEFGGLISKACEDRYAVDRVTAQKPKFEESGREPAMPTATASVQQR